MGKKRIDMLATGDRVFYVENGSNDTGTVVKVEFGGYRVKWDNGDEEDVYNRSQLEFIPEG